MKLDEFEQMIFDDHERYLDMPTPPEPEMEQEQEEDNMSNRIVSETVQWMLSNYALDELLDLHLELDGTPEDLFFVELSEQLAAKSPEHFVAAPKVADETTALPDPDVIDLMKALKASLTKGQ